jgi:hypothetical protein
MTLDDSLKSWLTGGFSRLSRFRMKCGFQPSPSLPFISFEDEIPFAKREVGIPISSSNALETVLSRSYLLPRFFRHCRVSGVRVTGAESAWLTQPRAAMASSGTRLGQTNHRSITRASLRHSTGAYHGLLELPYRIHSYLVQYIAPDLLLEVLLAISFNPIKGNMSPIFAAGTCPCSVR